MLALLLTTAAATFFLTPAAIAASDTCEEAASDDWSAAETWSWREICARRVADLDDFAGHHAPASQSARGWTKEHDLSAAYLAEILTEPRYVEFTSERQVRVEHARVLDYLDLSDMSAARSLSIEDSRFEGLPSLYNATTSRDVRFSGSTFVEDCLLTGSHIGGSLFLDKVKADKDLRFDYAVVDEDVYLGSSVASGAVNGNGARVQKSVLVPNASFGSFVYTYSQTGQNIELNSAIVSEKADLRGASTAGVLVFDSSIDELVLDDDTVTRDTKIENTKMRKVSAWDGQFGAMFSLAGSTVADSVAISNSRVVGALHLVDEDRHFTFDPEAEMNLRNTTVGSIDDEPASWPQHLFINGFRHTDDAATDPFILERDMPFYKAWLERDTYNRQPYVSLEKALRAAGRNDQADSVAVLRLDKEAAEGQPWRWPDRFLFKAAVGYGYKPWYALGPIVALIAFGAVVARRLPLDRQEIPSTIVLSAHLLVPLVSFGERFTKVDVTSGHIPKHVRRYFYLHVILGYVLAGYLVAALTRLTSRE